MPDPVKFGAPINTRSSEYLPMLDPTGRKLYFTSKRSGGISKEAATEGEFDEDLYYIEKSVTPGRHRCCYPNRSTQITTTEPLPSPPTDR